MKRLLSFVLSFIMIFGFSSAVYASNLSVDQKLQLMGVPDGLLVSIPEEVKKDMAQCYEKGGTFGGTDTQIVNMGNDTKVNTRSAISSSKLELEVTYITLPSDKNGTAHRKVYGNFTWLTQPKTFLCDAVSLEWGNGWVLSDNMDPAFVYQYYGAESGEIFSESTKLTTKNSVSVPNSGLCYTKLKLRTTVKNGNETAVDHNGWLMIELERDKGATSTNVITKYVQTKLKIISGGSISYKGGSLSVSPSIVYNLGQSNSNFVMR